MKAVDLFSGAGGWSTGASWAGVEVLAAANHWPIAVETHQRNHPRTRHFCQDVALMNPLDLPHHDLLLASPACQGHSRARGADRPHHDSQRSTAWCVISIAEVTRPRLIAVENVPEFVTKWALFSHWKGALETLGYHLSVQVLDASEFGVPQERRRVIVTGSLRRPIPIRSPRLPLVPMSEFIDLASGKWSPIHKPGRAPNTLARIEATRNRYGISTFVIPYFGCSRIGRTLDRPIGTLTTRDRYAVIHGEEMRMLTIPELKAAMSFPSDYHLTGTRTEQVKLMGNAMPPRMAQEVVLQMMGG